jgi:hypothetical protein
MRRVLGYFVIMVVPVTVFSTWWGYLAGMHAEALGLVEQGDRITDHLPWLLPAFCGLCTFASSWVLFEWVAGLNGNMGGGNLGAFFVLALAAVFSVSRTAEATIGTPPAGLPEFWLWFSAVGVALSVLVVCPIALD